MTCTPPALAAADRIAARSRVSFAIMEPTFADHFSGHAAAYAAARPTYPEPLYEWLSEIATNAHLVWDCATGNGQAAIALARRFPQVVATDASARQIANAVGHERVTYLVAAAENSGLDSSSVDLLTVAQALHWLDHESFFSEVRRVVKPGGAIAAWSYGLHQIDPDIDNIIGHFYSDVVGKDWPPQRHHVDTRYADIPWPFEEIKAPPLIMTQHWNFDQLMGYIATWSAVQRHMARTGADPITDVRDSLRAAWGSPARVRVIRWPLTIRAGRVPVGACGT